MEGSILLDNLFWVIGIFFAIIVIFSGIKTVPQSFEYIVERFGKYHRTLEPGINIIIPFLDKVKHKVSVRERVLDFPEEDVYSKDNVNVIIGAAIYYKIVNSKYASYRVEDLNLALRTTIFGQLRSVIGSMDTDEILSNRTAINGKISEQVKEAAQYWGVDVTRTELLGVKFSHEVQEAMEKQLKAERTKREEILIAEGEKRSVELRAEAQFFDVQKQSDAELYQKQKEAEAIEVVGKAIKEHGQLPAMLDLMQAQVKSIEKLSTSDNAKLIFAPNNSMASLFASGEGLKEIFGSNAEVLNAMNVSQTGKTS
tara:strand:- start:1923 stop:2858 length:936 start_codon:yes stop_codon:yes gene_type:complete